jgi:hypothetical protein
MSGIQSHSNREQMYVPLIRCIASLGGIIVANPSPQTHRSFQEHGI